MSEQPDVGFAPADPTDDRERGDWESRYSGEARKSIRIEAIYLSVHLFGPLIGALALAILFDGTSTTTQTSASADFGWRELAHAWLGGILGGSVYAIKWLYHVVAKNLWHIDRRLWRLFTPHVSGALAFAFIVLMGSGLIKIVDRQAMSSIWVCFGISFLVGYFSDNATAKLSEVARTIFGATTRIDVPNRRDTDKQEEAAILPRKSRSDG